MSYLFHHFVKFFRSRIGRAMCDKVMPAVLFMFSSHLLYFPIAFGGSAISRQLVVGT